MTDAAEAEREAWLAWRKGGIGGSDVWRMFTAPWALWAEKTGLIPDRPSSGAMRRGLLMEDFIASVFEHENPGLYVRARQLRAVHPDRPWMRVTLDGIVFEGEGALQLEKLAFPDNEWHANWKDDPAVEPIAGFESKADARFDWPEGIPDGYEAQAQWGMAVTGLERWVFQVHHGRNNPRTYWLDRDDDLIRDLIAHADHFWHTYVLPVVAPPMDASDATEAALKRAYPNEVKGTRVALDKMRDNLELRDRLKGELGWREAAIQGIENEVRYAMGTGEVGTLDGRPVLVLRTVKKRAYTQPAVEYRTLRAATKKDMTDDEKGNTEDAAE